MNLEINKLIEKGEELWHNPQLGFVAEITAPVQNVKISGVRYQLQVVITSDPEKVIKEL